ncbi:uroporphyrinogen-III synthase [Maioricimonas sp. JC845]|uniref:uroporphyrinogen-III synthase n=1 Tax=Maioricimonas sp. JC845 TaxID=3232138 RepID=UPI003458235E
MTDSLRVCSFESRRQSEMAALIERHGAIPTVAPSMREIPLEENPDALRFAAELLAGNVDDIIFLTGVGARALLDAATTKYAREELLSALDRCFVAVRGPKPFVVMREWGVHVDVRAPEPNTWRELLEALDAAEHSCDGRSVAVQEYGRPNEQFYAELRNRGANVIPVPVYRWALPEQTGPLEDAIRATVAGEFDVLMFTSANQITNVLTIAERLGLKDEWLAAAGRTFVASIGPTATEALTDDGLPPDFEPEHPKMGNLVRGAIAVAAESRNGT